MVEPTPIPHALARTTQAIALIGERQAARGFVTSLIAVTALGLLVGVIAALIG